ncbi:MAG TPA: hypothetical protein VLT45_11605 [Kofleriaceae bacterium]|nr:hypothetical protein [Kofleriaceae bacterium]
MQIYARKRDTPSWLLHLRFTTEGPSIGLEVAQDPEGKIRERFGTWVAAWSRGLAEHDLHLSIGGMLAPDQMDYPRPGPPRQGTAWPLGNLDLYLGKRWHGEHDPGKQVFERIRKAKLTAGVRRVDVSDDVMRIAFDCDLADAASVQSALVRGDSWLAPLVPTQITPGWNEHGDQMVVASTLVEREPFTYFDEDENIGYWAVDGGKVDEARWKKLAAIAKKGKLPDKTPVQAVRLVAPVRKQALALLQRAAADGFEMVTYPGGEDVFWRVFP